MNDNLKKLYAALIGLLGAWLLENLFTGPGPQGLPATSGSSHVGVAVQTGQQRPPGHVSRPVGRQGR